MKSIRNESCCLRAGEKSPWRKHVFDATHTDSCPRAAPLEAGAAECKCWKRRARRHGRRRWIAPRVRPREEERAGHDPRPPRQRAPRARRDRALRRLRGARPFVRRTRSRPLAARDAHDQRPRGGALQVLASARQPAALHEAPEGGDPHGPAGVAPGRRGAARQAHRGPRPREDCRPGARARFRGGDAMKAVCWEGTKSVSVETVPDPSILNPKDAIVRVTSTAICGSDLHLYGGYVPAMKKGDILGHEFMGEVVEVGSAVTRLRLGDRVVVPFAISFGACYYCQQGLSSLFDDSNPNAWMAEKAAGYSGAGLFGYSHIYGGYAGGQAQDVRVPFADVGPLPVADGIPHEQGPLPS